MRKIYKITYFFKGRGEALVRANNEEEAKQRWEGDGVDIEKEWGKNCELESISEVSTDEYIETCETCKKKDNKGQCECINKDSD